MKVIIIEDEAPAAERLKKMLLAAEADIEVLRVLSTVSGALAWLAANQLPDLIFMDIELSDGLSLDLFKRTRIECPVIFITAYDEYWQEAFEYNSIDYLLKPVKKERLVAALMVRKDGSKFILDHSLADIEEQVDPVEFYRINRKYLVNLLAVQRIHCLPKSKLRVEVLPLPNEELIISSECSGGFKKWMSR